MILPYISGESRPNRLETADKGEGYHLQYGRWALMGSNDRKVQWNIWKYIINYNFYKGNQWIFDEDLAPFLRDSTGAVTDRIRWSYNLVKPIVRYLRGMAIKTDFSVRAFNSSPFRMELQELERGKRLIAHSLSEAMPLLKNDFASQYNLGNSPQQTEQLLEKEFEEDYTDVATNGILRYIEMKNKFDTRLKKRLAEDLALAGKATTKHVNINNEFVWKRIDPAYHFYDSGAQEPDLSDADFQGDLELSTNTDLNEEFPDLDMSIRKIMETAIERNSFGFAVETFPNYFQTINGRLPRYNVYWHDSDLKTFGWVRDPIGLKMLACIEKKEDKATQEYEYTAKDIIPLNELTEFEREHVNGDGTMKRVKDVIRYCTFLAREFSQEDVVLDYGRLKGTDYYTNPFGSLMPYCNGTFSYHNGEVLTPLDDVIQPQRMMNRYLSMMEHMLNKSGGKNIAYDENIMSAAAGGEKGLRRKIKAGDPVPFDGSRYQGNLQNAIQTYDATTVDKAVNWTVIIQSLRTMTQQTTGINDFMMGMSDGTKILKSVSQQQQSMGTLMQEDFFYGMSDIFQQMYECSANAGRRLYAYNERKLVYMLQGKGVQVIELTRDMMTDDMSIVLRRVPVDSTSIEANNALLMQLYSVQLIGDEEFATLFNRAELDEVSYAVREFSKKKGALQEQMNAMNQEQQAKAEQQQQVLLQLDQASQERDRQLKSAIAAGVNQTKMMSDRDRNATKYQTALLQLRNK